MNKQSALRTLPGVDKLIAHSDIKPLIEQHGQPIVIQTIRLVLDQARINILNDKDAKNSEELIHTLITPRLSKQCRLRALHVVNESI